MKWFFLKDVFSWFMTAYQPLTTSVNTKKVEGHHTDEWKLANFNQYNFRKYLEEKNTCSSSYLKHA